MWHLFCSQTEMNLADGLSVYVHIPFCHNKCYFCDFFSVQNWPKHRQRAITAQILTQLQSTLRRLNLTKIETFYLCGGTPSLLSVAELAQFLNIAEQYHAKEITVEANPESLQLPWIQELFSRPHTRLSLGVQSFLTQDLRSLGRIVTTKQLWQSLNALAPYHTQVNFDFLAGLPHQTTQNLQQGLETLLSFQPGHFSFYMLTIEEGTVLSRRPHLIPNEDIRTDLWLFGREFLRARGYHDYEISNFTQSYPCLHNKRYWQLAPYLGIGPGAVSNIPLKSGQALRIQGQHRLCIWEEETPPIEKLYHTDLISAHDFLFEHFMMGWRTTQGVNITNLKKKLSNFAQPLLHVLQKDQTIPFYKVGCYWRLPDSERLNPNRHLLYILDIQERLHNQANK